MTEDSSALASPISASSIKAVINQFLIARLKLKEEDIEKEIQKNSDPSDLQKLHEKKTLLIETFSPKEWIADAAQRVGQIQQVTHGIK